MLIFQGTLMQNSQDSTVFDPADSEWIGWKIEHGGGWLLTN
jgi:hypothetical protein